MLVLVVWHGCLQLSSQEPCPVLRAASDVSDTDKTGCFVVVLKKESNDSTFEALQSKLLELSKDAHLYGAVRNIAKALTVSLNDSSLEMVRVN